MAKKIPDDAFSQYLALGSRRSYEAVARHFSCSKKAVTRRATKEGWQARVVEIERKAQTQLDEKAAESIEAMNSRHLRSLKAVQGKALEALKNMPIDSAMDAVRALDLSIRQERLIRGQPSDRTSVEVEQVIKREYESWLSVEVTNHGGDDDEEREDIALVQ